MVFKMEMKWDKHHEWKCKSLPSYFTHRESTLMSSKSTYKMQILYVNPPKIRLDLLLVLVSCSRPLAPASVLIAKHAEYKYNTFLIKNFSSVRRNLVIILLRRSRVGGRLVMEPQWKTNDAKGKIGLYINTSIFSYIFLYGAPTHTNT